MNGYPILILISSGGYMIIIINLYQMESNGSLIVIQIGHLYQMGRHIDMYVNSHQNPLHLSISTCYFLGAYRYTLHYFDHISIESASAILTTAAVFNHSDRNSYIYICMCIYMYVCIYIYM